MTDESSPPQTVNFQPQPGPQYAFLRCPVEDVLYGGARGGGKSYGVLGHFPTKAAEAFASHGMKRSFTGLLLRKTNPEFRQLLEEAKRVYAGIAQWESGHRRFQFPDDSVYGGAQLYFGYLDLEEHADRYQGLSLQWLCAEEAQNWATPILLDKLRATLRSSVGGKTYFVMTANPGGKGHAWIKERYVDPAPPNTIFEVANDFDGKSYPSKRVYIPSTLKDNKLLMENDPTYEARIVASQKDRPDLIRGWLYGDWNISAGGMFDDLWDLDTHVLEPFQIPHSWTVYRAYDWGSSSPFSIGWWARSDGTHANMRDGSYRSFPPGTLIRISEWYGADSSHKGLRMLERDIAQGVVDREKTFSFKVRNGPADSSIFNVQDGRSLADAWPRFGINWKHADKSPGSRVTGWMQCRQMLAASLQNPMEQPGLFVFNSCREFIRVFPSSQTDDRKPDDIDTTSEDHIQDETRYMVRHIPNVFSKQTILGL